MTGRPGTFDIWLRREAARREALEAERRRTLQRLLAWLDLHGTEHGVGRAAIFGSITRPHRFGARSDIDLGLIFDDARSIERFASAVEQATGRAIDIVDLQECRFACYILEEAVLWMPSRSAN